MVKDPASGNRTTPSAEVLAEGSPPGKSHACVTGACAPAQAPWKLRRPPGTVRAPATLGTTMDAAGAGSAGAPPQATSVAPRTRQAREEGAREAFTIGTSG